jgi:hypothetical protein
VTPDDSPPAWSPRSAPLTPVRVLALQRLVGNRAAQRLLVTRLARGVTVARADRRVQRVTSCSAWWRAQPGPAGAQIGNASLAAYWASIQPERVAYLPHVDLADVLEGSASPEDGRDKLDEFSEVLTWCETFWRETNADRDLRGVTERFSDLVDGMSWRDVEGSEDLARERSLWEELADEKRKADALNAKLANTCSEDLRTKHIVGEVAKVTRQGAVLKAKKTADDRTANVSTLINLSDGDYLAQFQSEVSKALSGGANKLTTRGSYPVIHVTNKTNFQVGMAKVEITRDNASAQDRKFNHFSAVIWDDVAPPEETDVNGKPLAAAKAKTNTTTTTRRPALPKRGKK